MPSEMRRLKQLEEENKRLKNLVADLSHGQRDASGGCSKKAVKPALKRELVDFLRECYQVSIRRACAFSS